MWVRKETSRRDFTKADEYCRPEIWQPYCSIANRHKKRENLLVMPL